MGKSSKDKRDAYYRLAKEEGWRARSAYKLLQLDEEFNLFEGVTRVVDLCAAPGSWSQVLSRVLIKGEKFGRAGWVEKQKSVRDYVLANSSKNMKPSQKEEEVDKWEDLKEKEDTKPKPRQDVKIVAIDLQPMSPLPGVTTLRADITHPSTIPLLLNALDPPSNLPPIFNAARLPDFSRSSTPSSPVDLVISDGAPDVTGLHDLDIYIQSQLLWAALNLSLCVLKPGGKFVAKIFRGKDIDLLFYQLKLVFERVRVAKPRSSRASSIEAFVVAEGFRGLPDGVEASLEKPLGVGNTITSQLETAGKEVKHERTEPSRTVKDDGSIEIDLGSESDSSSSSPTTPNADPESNNYRWIPPFLACGDLSAFDSDATYHLPKDRVVLEPVQPPTAPPYKRALEMRREKGGAYGKTKFAVSPIPLMKDLGKE